VIAGTSSTNISGTKDVASQAVKKDVSSLRYTALPNWFHEAHMETSNDTIRNSDAQDDSQKEQDCNADVLKSSGISNPTATLKVPSADQISLLKAQVVQDSFQKRFFSKKETQFLGNALTLSNRFKDTFRDATNAVDLNKVKADLSNMETSIPKEPKKIFDALKDPNWVKAIKEELLQFKIHNVWVLVDCPKGKEGIDYKEVFAPVARIKAIRLFLAYASFMGFIVYQMDVKSAFLHGTINEEVYVMQPPRFQDPEFPDILYKVEKAMYGLRQAPRAWYGTLFKYLLDNGFQRGTIDQPLFIKKHKGEFLIVQVGTIDQPLFIKKHKGEFLIVQVYVDDIIFGSSNLLLCREFEALMHDKFQMSAMGELTFFLGLQVLQKKDDIFLLQDKYVGDILKNFRYLDVRSANTPIDKENP
nr:hypothetical protein [Tanacetum cinerariifolium]